MSSDPTRRVWLVTGASRGFGQLIAAGPLGRGDAVVATARQPQAMTEPLGESSNLLPVPMLALVDSPMLPRLALGSDTVAKVREKNVFVGQELERWLELMIRRCLRR